MIFFPFYRWEQRIKENPVLNFTQIAKILGELPLLFESLLSLNEKDYKKSMDLIFDINKNLFNDIFYLYYKVGKNGTISCKKYEYFKKPHSIQEIERVFINYILFSLLINKSFGYKYSQFYQTSYGQLIKDLFNLFDYKNDKYEKEQETFPYKIILTIFEKHNKSITKLLKILWIKKLYPLSLYSLKKLGFLTDDENLKIYGINEEIIDFRYFNHYNIKLTDKEILLYLKILENFIDEELFKNKAENLFNDDLLKKANRKFKKNKEYLKYLYRGYLQNYIELQLYLIILSLDKLSYSINDLNISKQVQEIIKKYYEKSFYAKKIMVEIDYLDFNTKYMFYTFNENYQLIEKHINIVELLIREVNVTSNYNPNKSVMKELMYKNLLNPRYLFINNHIEDDLGNDNDNDNEKQKNKNIKYMNELINFLFVPLKKEMLPQYLQTAQKIYDDFWS
jgi:hypothetical protein